MTPTPAFPGGVESAYIVRRCASDNPSSGGGNPKPTFIPGRVLCCLILLRLAIARRCTSAARLETPTKFPDGKARLGLIKAAVSWIEAVRHIPVRCLSRSVTSRRVAVSISRPHVLLSGFSHGQLLLCTLGLLLWTQPLDLALYYSPLSPVLTDLFNQHGAITLVSIVRITSRLTYLSVASQFMEDMQKRSNCAFCLTDILTSLNPSNSRYPPTIVTQPELERLKKRFMKLDV